jgi:hypothetical protein
VNSSSNINRIANNTFGTIEQQIFCKNKTEVQLTENHGSDQGKQRIGVRLVTWAVPVHQGGAYGHAAGSGGSRVWEHTEEYVEIQGGAC